MKLLEKLLLVTEEIGSLSKGGTNAAQKYKYVKGEDAMSTFRELEVKHKIKVLPSIEPGTFLMVPKGDSGFITTFIVNYNIHDTESEEKLTVTLPVQGYNATDKGVYAAMTGGFKYFLLQTFSASTDDPEKDDKSEKSSSYTAKPTTSKSSFGSTPVAGAPNVPAAVVTPAVEETTQEAPTSVSPNRFKAKPSGFGPKLAPATTGSVPVVANASVPVTQDTPAPVVTKPTTKFAGSKFSDYLKKQ